MKRLWRMRLKPADITSEIPADITSEIPADITSEIPADITSEIPTGDRSIWAILDDADWQLYSCPTEDLLDLAFWIREELSRPSRHCQSGSDQAS